MPHIACLILTSFVKRAQRVGKMDSCSRKATSLGHLKDTLKFFGSTLYDRIMEMSGHRLDEATFWDALDIHFWELIVSLVSLLRLSRASNEVEVLPPSTTVSWGIASSSSWYTPLTHSLKVTIRLWFGIVVLGRERCQMLCFKKKKKSILWWGYTHLSNSSWLTSLVETLTLPCALFTTAQFLAGWFYTRSRIWVPCTDSVFWCLWHKHSLLWGRDRKVSLLSSISLYHFQNKIVCEDKLCTLKRIGKRTLFLRRSMNDLGNDVLWRPVTCMVLWQVGWGSI